jgi:hypothetical protein
MKSQGSAMEPKRAQAISERDQFWASLRALRPEIDRIAAEQWTGSERERQIAVLLARIVAAEMDFRLEDAAPE